VEQKIKADNMLQWQEESYCDSLSLIDCGARRERNRCWSVWLDHQPKAVFMKS